MTKTLAMFPLWVLALAAAVLLVGALVTADRAAMVAGVSVGAVFQAVVFPLLAARFPGRALLSYGIGMAARMALLAFAAFAVAPLARWSPAPFLISLVAILFATTLVEPVVLAADNRKICS